MAAGIGVSLSFAPAVLAVQPALAGEHDGIRFQAHTTYRLDPPSRVVRVTIDLSLKNEAPDEYSSRYVTQTYFPSIAIPVLPEAINLTATRQDNGLPLAVTLDPPAADQLSTMNIDLSPDLYFPQTQALRVSYDLPDLPPRSEGVTRVNEAFATLLAFGVGDPGLTSVEVVLPGSYDVETVGDSVIREDRGAEVRYHAEDIQAPEAWNLVVSARNDDLLAREALSVSGHDIEVRAWPGDQEWTDFVGRHVNDGLPVLEELIGQPWPASEALEITETVSPYLYGFAGWYTSYDNSIEIGDELDPEVVMHELSHVWFNEEMFADRWIGEAFAEEYASQALHQMGSPLSTPDPVDDAAPGALRLNEWSDPDPQEELSEEQETFGYNTSWSVLRRVRDEIGAEGLTAVIAAASDRTIAYLGDPMPEQSGGAADWRRLLDLLEEVGGSDLADDVFMAHVVTEAQGALMTEREEARSAYRKLDEAGLEWTPPTAVRMAMEGWDFDDAHELMLSAGQVLEVRDQLAATVRPLDLEIPTALEEAYETEREDLGPLGDSVQEHLDAARSVAAARATVDGDRGPWTTIGLWGADPAAKVDAAGSAFEDGELQEATASAAAAEDEVEDAQGAGQTRAAVAGGGVVLLALAGFRARVLARRRGAHRASDDPRVPGP